MNHDSGEKPTFNPDGSLTRREELIRERESIKLRQSKVLATQTGAAKDRPRILKELQKIRKESIDELKLEGLIQ